MLSRSTLLHLRIPFSFFLMPVYFFALAISPNLSENNILWSFLIIHLLLYPASNGYNSYFDKDEKSIGGLKNPPPVKKDLYYSALILDALAIVLALLYVSIEFAIMLLAYGLASKAYSHPSIRLKKHAIAGWLTVVFFQGAFAFLMCYVAINSFSFENLLREKVLTAAALTSIMLFGTYPMTQVYQHEEDGKRGDRTLSLILGIRGTFYFAMGFFGVAAVGFVYFFKTFYSMEYAVIFLMSLLPVIGFFLIWMVRVQRDQTKANHSSTMWLNFISALCLNSFFIYFFMSTSHIAQLNL